MCDTRTNPAANRKPSQSDALRECQSVSLDERKTRVDGGESRPKISDVGQEELSYNYPTG
jgi:hypothetical protein